MIKRSVLFTLFFLFSLLSVSLEAQATQFHVFTITGPVKDDYYMLQSIFYDIDTDATSLFIYFPLISDWFVYQTDYPTHPWHYSQIRLNSDTSTQFVRLDIDTPPIGDYDLNALAISLDDTGMGDFDSMSFELLFKLPNYVNKSPIGNDFLLFWNTNFEFAFDDDLTQLEGDYMVVYREGFSIWHRTYYNGVPPIPFEPYSMNESFLYWRTSSNAEYPFVEPLEPPTYPLSYGGYTYNLYATYEGKLDTGVEDIEGTDVPVIEDVLTLIGMNNPTGYLIVYVLIFTIITVLLVLLKLAPLVVIVADLILTAFFIFMGWIPMYATIIIILTLLVVLIYHFKKGGVT